MAPSTPQFVCPGNAQPSYQPDSQAPAPSIGQLTVIYVRLLSGWRSAALELGDGTINVTPFRSPQGFKAFCLDDRGGIAELRALANVANLPG